MLEVKRDQSWGSTSQLRELTDQERRLLPDLYVTVNFDSGMNEIAEKVYTDPDVLGEDERRHLVRYVPAID